MVVLLGESFRTSFALTACVTSIYVAKPVVSNIFVSPIKSCPRIAVSWARITLGFEYDRRYMLIEAKNGKWKLMTMRDHPRVNQLWLTVRIRWR